MHKHSIRLGMVILIFLTTIGLNLVGSTRDYWPTNNWQTSDPESHGVDATILDDMITRIKTEKIIGFHSFLMIKDGYLIREHYFRYYDKDDWHAIYSCTKSITSTLIGIAIDQGFLQLNDTVLDFFPEKSFEKVDDWKKSLTVENLLEMRAGITWDESSLPYTNSQNDYVQLLQSKDWVKYLLDRQMAAEPGTIFVYNSGASHVLSAIIQQITNMTTLAFAKQYLFTPLNITDFLWEKSPQNIVNGGAFLYLKPRDMAKFGYLFLNNGTWDGEVIVSSKWVQQAAYQYKQLNEYIGYGFQWWITPSIGSYFAYQARGYQGQWICCIPELDLLVVFTGGFTGPNPYDEFVEEYILPSVAGVAGKKNSVEETSFSLSLVIILIFVIRKKTKK